MTSLSGIILIGRQTRGIDTSMFHSAGMFSRLMWWMAWQGLTMKNVSIRSSCVTTSASTLRTVAYPPPLSLQCVSIAMDRSVGGSG